MLTTLIATFILIFTITDGRVLLYNTENEEAVEKFDCIYYVPNDGEEISYCRRLGGNQSLNRHRNECNNEGEKKLFHDLLKQEIHPSIILKWSSSVEIADLYARVFYNRSLIDDNDDQFVCNCTELGTFGKYCEYQLTHEAKTFGEAVKAQFEQKRTGDSWDTQRYGKILCYETLPCPSSPLCLDWREICDGVQRCSNGTDEENRDKLEFNECEDDEFRCTNGMCISEEFWLDGDYDCMDWSDEYLQGYGNKCPFEPNAIECDEHLCLIGMYSCGDGECVGWLTRMAFQRFGKAENDCFNKRNLNYMCEVSPHQPAWTLGSGLCLPDKDYDDPRYPSLNMINASKLTDGEKCQYLFRCALSKGFEHDCPCNHRNCTQMMMSSCSDRERRILYPPYGLINPNFFITYNYTHSMENPTFQLFLLSRGIRCRGYFFQATSLIILPTNIVFIDPPRVSNLLCAIGDHKNGYRDFLSPHQNNKFCWNDSLTFNGRPYAVNPDICTRAGECISQYRISDGQPDCFDQTDELMVLDKNYCTGNVGRHRFQCFNDQRKCLSLLTLSTGYSDCSNNYDEGWYGIGANLQLQIPCLKEATTDCHLVKAYIQQSSIRNSTNNTSLVNSQQQEPTDRISFRDYCDSFWTLDKHFDEMSSSCQYWICQNNQYKCQTGQCIELDWVCDGEWDCSDASDEEAIVLIQKWSTHNARLSSLPSQVEKCRQRYSKSPFSNICNTSFEFGCYLSQVSNPLDIQSNRPCINLTQIGDGIEDCYNAYDEKHTFTANSTIGGMWGFHSHCGNNHIQYPLVCGPQSNCTEILCSRYRDTDGSCSDTKDFICLGDNYCKKNARCNGIFDCLNGEDEYWCASAGINNQLRYRFDKNQMSQYQVKHHPLIQYPPKTMLKVNQHQLSKSIVNFRNDKPFNVYSFSYQCNRGIAVVEINEIRCLCPPAYYGDWCEFFSDRITIVAHIDQKIELKTILNGTLKIKANFLFNNKIIDHHEFHVVSTLERNKTIKHKFYLLYSRSVQMLEHKKWRYFNRNDIINNHPYSVHLDVFTLEKNNSVQEIGSWHYPIYFDYLPAFRLAVGLKFPSWFGNETLDPCSKNSCNENSTCLSVFNQNNSYYCSCKSGYYGINCSMYEPLCETYCSVNALCRVNDTDLQAKKNKPYCICPLGHFGPRCNLKYDECNSNSCLNNGTCFPNYDPNGEKPYECNCLQRFYGSQCQNEKASVHIDLNMINTLSARAAVVQLYDISVASSRFIIRHQQIYNGLPSSISYYHSDIYAPGIGILKIYEDLSHPQYFLMYALSRSKINMTSSPQHCPHASLLLSEDTDQSVPSVFQYHHICQNNTQRVCFYDENYFCICQRDHYRAECFILDIEYDHCYKCFSGGKCLQGDLKDPNDFICLCPSCHEGHRCEFSMQAFSFTLDSLLVNYSKVVKIIYVCIVCLLFIIGLFNNICSFITFKRPTPRKFSVGNYLLIVSCFNQVALFCLLFKIIEITIGILNVVSCKSVSYSLAVMTRSTYWLTSWITVDRLLMILFPTSSFLKNPRVSIGISVFTLIILFVMHVHEIIYYTIIQHLSTDSSICVTNFDSKLISTYNRISTLIHYLFPFFIQIICITLLIILVARSRMKTAGHQMTFGDVLKKQFETQKELYVTPTIIILSALPQAILTFSFACTQLNHLQRHALLCSYLLSYAPQVLGFILYVLPSTSYRKEFYETFIWKKSSKLMLSKTKSKTTIINTKTKTSK